MTEILGNIMTSPKSSLTLQAPKTLGAGQILTAALLTLGLSLWSPTVSAQGMGTASDLTPRINQLENDVARMQESLNFNYTDTAGLETGGEPAMARVALKVNQMESALRDLNGRVEELLFRMNQMDSRFRRVTDDSQYRLQQLEGVNPQGAMIAASPDGQRVTTRSIRTTTIAVRTGNNSGQSAQPPQSLGTVPAGAVSNTQNGMVPGAAGAAAASMPIRTAALPSSSGRSEADQYQFAISQLQAGKYDQAEIAFTQFVNAHAGSPLAGNAQYWLGETYYVRDSFENAAKAFLLGYQKYPGSQKGPDTLLKLGMTLAILGEKQDACVTFADLPRIYPSASPTIRQRADLEGARTGC